MIDAMQTTQDAVFTALAAAVAKLESPWLVRQHVPQGTQPPFQFVGTLDSESDGSKGAQFERITVQIVTVFRGEERGPLLDMMQAARAALDGQPITADGVDLSPPRFITASASIANRDDGVTYAGVSSFEVWAEPA